MIKTVGIVTFDVKVGQKIEIMEPSRSLTNKEKDTISSLAIPENTAIKGNAVLKYYFTFYSGERKYLKKHYCYVYFVQKKDLTLPRNYLQKSLFIVSPYFIPSLFLTVLSKVSKLLFRTKNLNLEDLETNELLQDNLAIEDTKPLIESVYNVLSKWNMKEFKHERNELPFLGSMIEFNNIYYNLYSGHVTLNSYLCLSEYFLSKYDSAGSYFAFKRLMYNNLNKPLMSSETTNHTWPDRIFSSLKSSWLGYWKEEKHLNIQRFLSYSNSECSPLIKNLFKKNFKQLLHLWQLVLTGKSILIIAPNPSICTEIATFLSSLILPLDPGFDFLPYVNNMYGEFEDIKYLQEFKVFLYKIVGCTSVFYASILDQFDCVIFIKDETKCIKIHKAEYEIKEVLQSLMNVFNPFANKTNHHTNANNAKRQSIKVNENKNGIYYRPNCRPMWSVFYNSPDDIIKTSKDLFTHLNKHQKAESEHFIQNTMLIFQKLTLNSLKPFFSYFGYYPIISSYFNCFNMYVSKYSNRKNSDENLFEVLKGKFVKQKINQNGAQDKRFFESFEKYFDKCFIYIVNLSIPEFKKANFLKFMSRTENLTDLKFSRDYMFVNKRKTTNSECHFYKLDKNVKYVNSSQRVDYTFNNREGGDIHNFYKDFVGSENFYSWFNKYQSFTFVETYKLYCQKVAELTISFDITLLENFSFMFLLNRLENNYELIDKFEDLDPNLKSISLKKLKKLIVSIKDISSMDSVSY